MEEGLFTNFILSLLLKKVIVPTEFHAQVGAVKEMMQDDVSGLVDSLTDFAVNTASVDFSIESDNTTLSEKLKKWLEVINIEYAGKLPSGINALAKEYFKERWKHSSFPVLKILDWKRINGIIVPSKMFFVDGGSIYAEDKNSEESLELFSYNYFLGRNKDEKLDKDVIFTRPYGRWFDKYPTPFLIKRGIYHNWRIVESLKNAETKILEQIIPYMLLIKKGTERLQIDGKVTYDESELQNVIDQMQELVDTVKDTNLGDNLIKSPIRASQFDEEIKHLIPDLSTIFNRELFVVAERNILSGLGFIDVVEATSTSRRESILNPKGFIEEVKRGVDDFKELLRELVIQIKQKNDSRIKYMNSTFHIVNSPVKGFLTDDFKEKIRQLYDRGRLSSQTAVELIAETDFRTEVYRREKEAKEGIETTMYPQITRNQEGVGVDIPGEEPVIPPAPQQQKETEEEEIPEDKVNEVERQNYDIGVAKILEGAPFPTLKSLPDAVKKLSKPKQRKWMKIFNNAYSYYLGKLGDAKKAETLAFQTAWSKIKEGKSKKKS